jgi:hypothetical protein
MASLDDHSIRKAAATRLIDICKRGLLDKNAVYKAMCVLADEVGQSGESSATRFVKAYASGVHNRVPNGNALLQEYNKLSHAGGLPFHFTPQFGDESPAESARRVTVTADDTVRTNLQFQPYSYSSEPQVISPVNATALDSWQDAIREIMQVSKVSYSQAVNIAQQDPSLRDKWEAAKAARFGIGDFSPLLTKKSPHGFGGMPDPPLSDTLDDEADDRDDRRQGAHRRPRLRKRDLPIIAAALKRYYGSGGGGIPR